MKSQAGFSLVEIVVAIPMTLLTMGVVYAVLAAAQRSFVSDPARADRQQNIRVAMETIATDVAAAGVSLPAFVQTFTPGLDDDPEAPTAPDRAPAHADGFEVLTNLEGHELEPVCGRTGGAVTRIFAANVWSDVPDGGVALILTSGDRWTARQLSRVSTEVAVDEMPCDTAVDHVVFQLTPGQGDPTLNVAGDLCAPSGLGTATEPGACEVVSVSPASIVSYRIRVGEDGVPNLERRSSASFSGRNYATAFEVVARGIEDLRLEYAQVGTPDVFRPTVSPVVAGDYRTLVSLVRITLAARTTGGGPESHSTLVSTVSVRAALAHAAQASSEPVWK